MIRAADIDFPVDTTPQRTSSWPDVQRSAARVEARRRAVEKFITRTQNFAKPRALVLVEYAVAGLSFAVAAYLYIAG